MDLSAFAAASAGPAAAKEAAAGAAGAAGAALAQADNTGRAQAEGLDGRAGTDVDLAAVTAGTAVAAFDVGREVSVAPIAAAARAARGDHGRGKAAGGADGTIAVEIDFSTVAPVAASTAVGAAQKNAPAVAAGAAVAALALGEKPERPETLSVRRWGRC